MSIDAGVDTAGGEDALAPDAGSDAGGCTWIDAGVGPAGKTKLTVETVASGLEIPWALAFPSSGEILVTEMNGRLRLAKGGKLVTKPVLQLTTPGPAKQTGQGLQGLVLHPQFASNRLFYLHHALDKGGGKVVNRVVRYKLAPDSAAATQDKVILDEIPAGFFHNGGRMRFGPDKMLYVSTGDANAMDNSKDKTSLAGKLLRLTAEGQVPADNPWPGNPALLLGLRNSQGFDFLDAKRIYVVDHGPSGELGRVGQDEISLASPGDDLGWPAISGCSTAAGKVTPALSWKEAVPPGAALLYQGTQIPGWKGSLIVTSLGKMALLRIVFDPKDPGRVTTHEVYLEGDTSVAYGRLRAVEQGPDGQLYVTTSNCDDNGTCDPPKDRVLRIR